MAFKATNVTFFILMLLVCQEIHGIGDDTQQLCNDFDPNRISNTDGYRLHRVLKEGLANNSKNLYNIQKAKLKHKSDSKIACLPVMFELQCNEECSLQIKSNDTDLECSMYVNGTKFTFLWSSFDASKSYGSFLLSYTEYDLRVYGFGWEDDCEQYQVPINISIYVDEIPCVTRNELCSALMYITTLVSTL